MTKEHEQEESRVMPIRYFSGVPGVADGWYIYVARGSHDGPHESLAEAKTVRSAILWAQDIDW